MMLHSLYLKNIMFSYVSQHTIFVCHLTVLLFQTISRSWNSYLSFMLRHWRRRFVSIIALNFLICRSFDIFRQRSSSLNCLTKNYRICSWKGSAKVKNTKFKVSLKPNFKGFRCLQLPLGISQKKCMYVHYYSSTL